MQIVIEVTNKHTAKLHHVGYLNILTYDARKLKHKIQSMYFDSEKKKFFVNQFDFQITNQYLSKDTGCQNCCGIEGRMDRADTKWFYSCAFIT